jgi:hypothetical protein
VYASAKSDAMMRAYTAAGAAVVLQKSADRRSIVQGLRAFDEIHHRRGPSAN